MQRETWLVSVVPTSKDRVCFPCAWECGAGSQSAGEVLGVAEGFPEGAGDSKAASWCACRGQALCLRVLPLQHAAQEEPAAACAVPARQQLRGVGAAPPRGAPLPPPPLLLPAADRGAEAAAQHGPWAPRQLPRTS